jgi:glycosyltransferase involved in cell wall biosynthesis
VRILHLISSSGYYGAENMLLTLAKGLRNVGCSSVIGVFQNSHNPNQELAVRARTQRLETLIVACRGKVDLGTIRFLHNYIKRHEINVVHTHGYKANLYGLLASRGLSVPIIATCHNWTRQTIALRIYACLDILILKRFAKVVSVSMDVAERLRAGGLRDQRVTVIHNGVEVCAKDEKNEKHVSCDFSTNETVIGAVGRLVPEKGFQYLFQAAPTIIEKFPHVKFLIIGEGPFRKELEDLSRDLGIQSHVVFTGKREDMKALYDRMDIFVLPSLNEGMPMSILEAMAAQRPVIGTAVGGVPALVIPEQTGLLVQPADSAGLTGALIRLMNDSDLRTSLAERAHKLVFENYSAQSMTTKYCSLYDEIIRPRLVA